MKQWNGEEFVNEWHGYHMDEGRFMGQPYVVICPKEGTANGQWALKTEYFGAFPQLELDLLARGYHLAHVKTYERYCPPPVTELQACFVDFVSGRYGLSPKCVPIGMSCGGLQAIYLAGKHPDKVACAYIDAPVVNFLSVPFCMGKRNASNAIEEFENAWGINRQEILTFRGHPLDYIPNMITNRIPVVLVCGDSDTVVPFEENGKLLLDAYKAAGCPIECHMKPGGDHHPHCLPDNAPIVAFIEKYTL